MQNKKNTYTVVCFGEMLWDILANGRVPGGAPMNVAYHLKKLGTEPALISRIGNDECGSALLDYLKKHFISIDFIQTDPLSETGRVIAKLMANNEVQYTIKQSAAWDNIQPVHQYEKLVSEASYFVFGSLITRNSISKNTLYELTDLAKFNVMDINLRSPFIDKRNIEYLLNKVSMLKLNTEELLMVSGWYGNYKNDEERILMIQDRFHIPDIVLTKGEKGALFFKQGLMYGHSGYTVNVADTIGCGDAFLAALLTKLSMGDSPAAALEFSCGLGALIAGKKGGCPEYQPEEVSQFIEKTNYEFTISI